ncbi:MAG: hypothetical protein ABW321_00255 [Polyangiales bacterium]
MSAPRRLLDDPALAAELRTDMQRFAQHSAPYDAASGFEALRATLDLPPTPPDPTPSGSGTDGFVPQLAPSASGSTLLGGTALSIKLGVIAAVGGIAALGVSWLQQPAPATAPRERPVVSAPAVVPSAGPAQAAPAPEVTAVAAPSGDSEPLRVQEPSAEARRPAGPSPSRREIAQLLKIKALLETDPAAAHRLIRVAQREFPSGVLVEEREALDAIALFKIGPPSRARAAAERFFTRHPQSPLRDRLERLLAAGSEAPDGAP